MTSERFFNVSPNIRLALWRLHQRREYDTDVEFYSSTDMEDTVDKFQLRPHFRFGRRCLGARWLEDRQEWEIELQNVSTKENTIVFADVLLTAVGGFSQPRRVVFPGMSTFKGPIFHTAE